MCAMILNAIWPLTNNVEKGESGGVLQQQVTCVLKQRIILRIRRLGFGFVGVLIIVLVGFFFVGAATYVHVPEKAFAEFLIYDFVN